MNYTIGKITFGPLIQPLPAPKSAPRMQETRDCTSEEFEAFIKTYPRRLERDVYMVCEPPAVTFNDFTLGMWPASVVAGHTYDDREGKVKSGWYVLKEMPKESDNAV